MHLLKGIIYLDLGFLEIENAIVFFVNELLENRNIIAF